MAEVYSDSLDIQYCLMVSTLSTFLSTHMFLNCKSMIAKLET